MKNCIIIIFSIISSISVNAQSQEIIKNPALKAQIDSLALIEKNIQDKIQKTYEDSNQVDRTAFKKMQNDYFIRHTVILKSILEKYGYPSLDLVGKIAADNYWLCVQNCDLKFHNKVLKAMKKQVKRKQADSYNYAYLRDKVNLNMGKLQIYGTKKSVVQVRYVGGETAYVELVRKLKNRKNVNKRRAKIGLEPIERDRFRNL